MTTIVVFTLRQAQGDSFHRFSELAGDLGSLIELESAGLSDYAFSSAKETMKVFKINGK